MFFQFSSNWNVFHSAQDKLKAVTQGDTIGQLVHWDCDIVRVFFFFYFTK